MPKFGHTPWTWDRVKPLQFPYFFFTHRAIHHPTHGYFVLSPVSLPSRNQYGSPSNLMIDTYLQSYRRIGDCEQSTNVITHDHRTHVLELQAKWNFCLWCDGLSQINSEKVSEEDSYSVYEEDLNCFAMGKQLLSIFISKTMKQRTCWCHKVVPWELNSFPS